MPKSPIRPEHCWQSCVGAGLGRHGVGFAATCFSKRTVLPARAGIHAGFPMRNLEVRQSSRRARGQGRRWCAAALSIAASFFASGAATAQLKPDTAGIATTKIEVTARPIARFAKAGAAPTLSPRLEWRGGLELASFSTLFGGWSGVALSPDGTRLVAVSDSGVWMTGEIAYDGVRPQAVRAARIGALRTLKGKPLGRQRERDAEAITLLSGTPRKGTALIAFEQADRIGVFPIDKDGLGKPSSYLTIPKEAARMRMDGIEALAVLAGGPRKGAIVAFAENPLRGEKVHRGWVWVAGTPRGFTVPGIEGFSITDAAGLADGSVLIVERRFRWLEGLRVRLRLLAADGIKPGGTATGEILLEATNANAEIDNLEALALSTGEDGETVVTLMSDDNFNRFLQRTVLLQFTLKDKPMTDAAAHAAPAAAP
jgi:hypothetical protein